MSLCHVVGRGLITSKHRCVRWFNVRPALYIIQQCSDYKDSRHKPPGDVDLMLSHRSIPVHC